ANLKVRLSVKAGTRAITATFLQDTVVPEGIVANRRDTAFFEGVGSITVAGPFNVQGPGNSPSREKIFICRPAAAADEPACAERIISNLAHRAYRRPVAPDDLPPILAQYRKGARSGGFEAGIRLALQSILVSPEFVFRMEFDPPGAAAGSVNRVSDVE